jgi:hypothetical protein
MPAQEAQAEIAAERARAARDEAPLTLSKYLADVSLQVTEQEHDPVIGLPLAPEALRGEETDDDSIKSRPYLAWR